MSGFWAAGPGWSSWVVAGCLSALGLLLGAWWGQGRGWKQCEEDMRVRRAQAAARRTSLIDYRPPEIAHEAITWVPQTVHEAWLAHEEQALALAAGETLGKEWDRIHPGWREDNWREQQKALVRADLTDSAYTQDMGERMTRFLDDLLRVPYSADELWSGQ